MITYAFRKWVKLAHWKKALHTPWCHIISGLWRVSLAEYLLVLRVYSHLLQVVMYHGYCTNWLTPAVVAECDHGHDPSELSCLSCFCWKLTLVLACIWIKAILVSKLLCFRYLWTWVVITLPNSDICWITYEMDVTYDLLCWTTMILACMLVGLKSLVILLDYRSYRSLSTGI
jgi:hypothetical protein